MDLAELVVVDGVAVFQIRDVPVQYPESGKDNPAWLSSPSQSNSQDSKTPLTTLKPLRTRMGMDGPGGPKTRVLLPSRQLSSEVAVVHGFMNMERTGPEYSNAIKYNQFGQIHVILKRDSESPL